ATQSKGANKCSKLGSAASQWTCILERIQETSFGSRQQSRDRNQREGTNSANKAGALLCKVMHTVTRIITIDKQLRSIKVVSNWGESTPWAKEPKDVEPRSKQDNKVQQGRVIRGAVCPSRGDKRSSKFRLLQHLSQFWQPTITGHTHLEYCNQLGDCIFLL